VEALGKDATRDQGVEWKTSNAFTLDPKPQSQIPFGWPRCVGFRGFRLDHFDQAVLLSGQLHDPREAGFEPQAQHAVGRVAHAEPDNRRGTFRLH